MVFREYYKLGINIRKADAFPALKYHLDLLNKIRDDFTFVAKIGLCHGLFSANYSEEVFENDYAVLKELIPEHYRLTLLRKKF